MKLHTGIFLLLLILGLLASSNAQQSSAYTIAFGSCSNQSKPQPILNKVCQHKPNTFIYLGDNIYGDTRNMEVLKAKYQQLAKKPAFKRLKKNRLILATWDDHDFGENDAGRYYPHKEASKEIFLNFWQEPKSSTRWTHKGIYHRVFLEDAPIKIQVILLDTRTFRDNLIENHKEDKGKYKNDYQPNPSPDSAFLGEAQWAWLEETLQEEADLRIVASSNQFSHEYNGWESWRNVPREQERMLQLIKKTKANGIVFISGDVHWGELSKYDNEYTYPIYDITSSGLTQKWHNTEANKYRIGEVIRTNNFGLIEIDDTDHSKVTFKLIDKSNTTIVKHSINLSELTFK